MEYYFIQYAFYKDASKIAGGRPTAGESCNVIDDHPFTWMEGEIKKGFKIILKFYKKITESEYRTFRENFVAQPPPESTQ